MRLILNYVKELLGAFFNTNAGWSRGFWLYCALLSLAVFPVAVGQFARAPTFSMNRVGPVIAERGEPRAGVVVLAFGTALVGVCLFNVCRARP